MSSQDIYIVIDGQEYQISGNGKSRSEIQSAVIDKLDSIEYRIGRIEQELEIMKHDQSALQTSVYWVLAGIGIFIAALTIPQMIASIFRKPAPDENKAAIESLSAAFMKGISLGREQKN